MMHLHSRRIADRDAPGISVCHVRSFDENDGGLILLPLLPMHYSSRMLWYVEDAINTDDAPQVVPCSIPNPPLSPPEALS
jgi:hypothetical protein